jgi:predicted RNase H-like nuclease (RuvC/YqgF family)
MNDGAEAAQAYRDQVLNLQEICHEKDEEIERLVKQLAGTQEKLDEACDDAAAVRGQLRSRQELRNEVADANREIKRLRDMAESNVQTITKHKQLAEAATKRAEELEATGLDWQKTFRLQVLDDDARVVVLTLCKDCRCWIAGAEFLRKQHEQVCPARRNEDPDKEWLT